MHKTRLFLLLISLVMACGPVTSGDTDAPVDIDADIDAAGTAVDAGPDASSTGTDLWDQGQWDRAMWGS